MNQDIYVLVEHLNEQIADISYLMLAAGRQLSQETGGELLAILLGHQVDAIAANLAADRVLYVDHPALAAFTPDAYQAVLLRLIADHSPRLVIFGDTSVGADIAGTISVKLNLPLVSYCQRLAAEGDTVKFISQVCGGKIMAEGELLGPTALVTMIPGGYRSDQTYVSQPPEIVRLAAPSFEALRVEFRGYLEPEIEDVDISKEPLLIAIGRGIQNQNNIELVEELAKLLGAQIAASRPVVDQGWMPATRLVGKSGRRVKPRLYLALGISGAPEHVEAITDAGKIIAVNTDPLAPIFDVADYGIEMDLFDLLPVLSEKIEQTRHTLPT